MRVHQNNTLHCLTHFKQSYFTLCNGMCVKCRQSGTRTRAIQYFLALFPLKKIIKPKCKTFNSRFPRHLLGPSCESVLVHLCFSRCGAAVRLQLDCPIVRQLVGGAASQLQPVDLLRLCHLVHIYFAQQKPPALRPGLALKPGAWTLACQTLKPPMKTPRCAGWPRRLSLLAAVARQRR